MRTVAVLPIKSFGAAKTRLAGLLGSGSRQAVAQAMFCDTLYSLRRVPGLDAIAVVTSDRVAESAATGHGVMLLRDDREAGHNAAVDIGIRHALAGGFERVLLVPGDTPLLDPGELAGLLAALVGGRSGRGHRARPPRQRHQRAADLPAGRLLAELRARTACAATSSRPGPSGLSHSVEPLELPGARHRHARGPGGALGRARGAPGPGAAHARRDAPARPVPGAAGGRPARRRARPEPRSASARSPACRRSPPATTSRRCSAAAAPPDLADGDVLVVAHKVVSKAEGRTRRLAEIRARRARPGARRRARTRTRAWCRPCWTRPPRCCAPSAGS